MKYIFEMPPDKIMFLAMVLESYEDVAVVTTIQAGEKTGAARREGRYRSLVAASVADDYDELFHKIIRSLNDAEICYRPAPEKE